MAPHTVLVLSLVCSASAHGVFLASRAADQDFPTPSIQTEGQKMAFAEKQAQAKLASEAATADVLAFFDLPEFRSSLRNCCSGVADLSSQKLLEAFRAEVRAAELCHHVGGSHDITTELGLEYPFFPNIDQCKLIDGTAKPSFMDAIEDDIFGTPPYADPNNKTWDEAASRLIYIAHNLRQVDMGSPIFGQASAVFSTEYAKNMVIIAAMDTGMYKKCMNSTEIIQPEAGFGSNVNCSAWSPPVAGTLDYHDHLILANLGLYAGSDNNTVLDQAAELFARSGLADGGYAALPALTGSGAKKYWEANILGNPRYPDGIRHLVAVFGSYFGTEDGRKLQQWADMYSWPLVWALGDPSAKAPSPSPSPHVHPTKQCTDAVRSRCTSKDKDVCIACAQNASADLQASCPSWPMDMEKLCAGSGGKDFPGNHRILDPTVEGSTRSNARFPDGAFDAFGALWQEVAEFRSKTTPNATQVDAWWATLRASQVRVGPATARACTVPDACVGIDLDSGDCIC